MSKYRVNTDQGSFMVTLDKPPASPADIEELRLALEGMADVPASEPTPPSPPTSSGGFLDTVKSGFTPPPLSQGFLQEASRGIETGLRRMKQGGQQIFQDDPRALLNIPLGAAEVAGAIPSAAGQTVGRMIAEHPLRDSSPEATAMAATLGDLATQGVAGAVPKIGGQALRWLGTKLPGAAGAMREEAARLVQAKAGGLFPTDSSTPILSYVRKMNPLVPTEALPRFRTAVQSVIANEQLQKELATHDRELIGMGEQILKRLQDTITPTTTSPILGSQGQKIVRGGQVQPAAPLTYNQIDEFVSRVGDMVHEYRMSGRGQKVKALSELRGSLMDDMAEISAPPGNASLQALWELGRQGKALYRREKGAEEVMEIVRKGLSVREGSQLDVNPAFSKMLNSLRDKRLHDKRFRESLDPVELDDMENFLLKSAKLELPPPPKGQHAGSSTQVKRFATGTLTGIGGAALVVAASTLSRLMMTPAGRKALLFFIRSTPGGILTPERMMTLASAARVLEPQAAQLDSPQLGPSLGPRP